MADTASKLGRLDFLDWTRGFAAAVMLQGHVFHSFTSTGLKQGSAYVLSQFVGGLPPAVFLFLTGVTLAFLMDHAEKQSLPRHSRWMKSLRRAGYLWGMAFLFRLQLYLLGWGQTNATDLFTVDILNCMGLAIAIHSLFAFLDGPLRARAALGFGIVIACASPLISGGAFSWMHPYAARYFVPDVQFFSFFPWAAYLSFGLAAGTLLRLSTLEKLNWLIAWSAAVGIVLIFASQYFSNIPFSLYENSEFWLNSPALIFIKTGITLLIIAAGHLWLNTYPHGSWSWLCQLGKASMLVYWVHIELVYGRWMGSWKSNLSIYHTTLLAATIMLLMLGLAVIKVRWWNPLRIRPLHRDVGLSAPEPLQ